MNIKFILFCCLIVLQSIACVFIEDLSPKIIQKPTGIVTTTPVEKTPTPSLSESPSFTIIPSPDQSDVCIIYPEGESIWLKQGSASPKEIGNLEYQNLNATCPPETLLPEIEVNIADIGTPETYEMRNLIPHLCLQHPIRQEVWFNTERPQIYGLYYQSDLWRFIPENNSVELILPDSQGGQFISFSPDGEYLILAGSEDVRLMRSDGSNLHQIFEFPTLSICSEVNVWVTPWWYPDSSGVILNVQPGCLNDPASWPFGLWWIPTEGVAVSIDAFALEFRSDNIMNSSPDRRVIDKDRYVYLEGNTLFLSQENYQSIDLISLERPVEGFSAFLCPNKR